MTTYDAREPAALAEPTVSPPARWVGSVVLLNLGIIAGWFGPIQVLLAEQAKQVDPAHKEGVLAVVLLVGALVSTVANPVFGALSDRTTSRRGRRLPWVVGGVLTGAASLCVLALAGGVVTMVLAWSLVQLTLNAAWAALTAAVPDQVPVPRRGLIGGLIALAGTVGVLLGIQIAAWTGSVASGYVVTAIVVVVLAVPYVLGSRDLALPSGYRPPPFRWGAFARSFWVSPREHPDFAWAWLTRFLVNLGNFIALTYLFYFLTDGLGLSDHQANTRLAGLTAAYGAATVVTAVVVGWWSDRVGRRKVFVIWSGIVVAAAGLVLATWQSLSGVLVAAIVLGCGYGIYQAVDFALITQVLPGADERAKDLGVINIAASLPQVFAPAIAGGLLLLVKGLGGSVATHGESWSAGYATVYFAAFALSILGSVLVSRIRSVP